MQDTTGETQFQMSADNVQTEEEREKLGRYWSGLAMVLGYNELAKTVNDAGQKSFFRFMRDGLSKKWAEEDGGMEGFITYDDEKIVTITAQQPPHIVFYERDIEMMRDAVYEYDKKKRTV